MNHLQQEKVSYWGLIKNGIFKENTIFRLVISLCPSIAVTNSVRNGFLLGVAVLFVQTMVNSTVALLRNFIHPRIRLPIFMLIISGWVTVVDLLMQAYARAAYKEMGLYIEIIVAFASILARAEMFASKNKVGAAFFDGLGSGLGFLVALVLISFFRELLGRGSLWGFQIVHTKPMLIMLMPTGGFLVVGLLMGFFNWIDINFYGGKGAGGAGGH
ncbi:MAG TPA: electron transport complex subunit RsxE [Nitrospirae bacterium]|jgi:electron transport complex protein RnfE|nr:electron transport complex subunit RsxE [Nitrospirota bacterium]